MNASFAGKKLLVVGGTSGMGFETAKLVLKNGGSVVLVGNRQDKAEQARQALAADGQVSIIVADLMKEEGMQHVVNTINAEHKILACWSMRLAYFSRNRSPNMKRQTMTCT